MVEDWGEFKVGNTVRSQSRTVTEGDFSAIVNISSGERPPAHR